MNLKTSVERLLENAAQFRLGEVIFNESTNELDSMNYFRLNKHTLTLAASHHKLI